MKNGIKKMLVLLSLGFLVACGGNNNSSTSGDQGGPDALEGYMWKSAPVSANGFDFVLAFQFEQNKVKATNTCSYGGASVSVSTEAPVDYRYTVDVPNRVSQTNSQGGNNCEVSIEKAMFNAVIQNGKLVVTQGDQSITFDRMGAENGIYSTWQADTEVGRLTWTMGGGKINANLVCSINGLSVSAEAPATFVNILDIKEAAMNSKTENGLECNVSIAKGLFNYRFDGTTLVLTQNGQEAGRFSR